MSRGRGTKKRGLPENPHTLESFDEAILEEVNQLFSKVKTYSAPPGTEWRLPDPSTVLCEIPWSHPPLQKLKKSLNEVKNQLNDKDLAVWHQHTFSTNRAGIVTSRLRETANAELCTQAWAKFYEIQGTFKLLPDAALHSGELNSVHLCEAPGAFISALNHFLQTNRLHCDWTWVANTLNPYHEANARNRAITDDRLIAHTVPWWFFGSDNTGDIMLQKHLLELQEFVSTMRSVGLVTADGSFDCQGDPGEQESLVAPLQYCESVCALLLLAPGGSFVLKMFTLFEHSSICLLYMLACCFGSVHVFKPATSKSGNSEVYVVCLDFKSKDAVRPLLSKLIRNYGPDLVSTAALFPKRCIPNSFLEQHEEICTFFQGLQIGTIQENLRLFTSMTAERRMRLDQLRECTAQFYMQRFHVQPLSRRSRVCQGGSMAMGKPCQRKQAGSFNQRKEMQFKEWKQRLAHGPHRAWIEEHVHAEGKPPFALAGPGAECDLNAWFGLVGATLPKVQSSAFCEAELLDLLNKALEESAPVRKEEPLTIAACRSCVPSSPTSILNEFCSYPLVTSCTVMVGNPSWQDVQLPGYEVQFCPGPSYPELCVSPLHDGDPFHQYSLLSSVFSALCRLADGSSLVVPLSTALTRFTASLVLALHLCFQSITYHCLVGGPPVVLMCAGFTPATRINAILQDVLDQMRTRGPSRQILQFAPIEELTRGPLPRFLSSLNNTVMRQQLHLLLTLQKKR